MKPTMPSLARPAGSAPLCMAEGEERATGAVPSFELIYDEHFDYVWRTARRLGVKADEADDVVQEIFLAVHILLPRYESGNVRGWLYAIAVRTVMHHHRSRRRFTDNHQTSDELDAMPDANEPGPESSAATGESIRLLERLLDRLDTEKRAVLVLAGIEQKSLAEIGAILDLNINTVSSRLRAAREQLQEGLARHRARARWRTE